MYTKYTTNDAVRHAEIVLRLFTHTTDVYEHRPRQAENDKWKRFKTGSCTRLTAQHLQDHLTGKHLYATQSVRNGLTSCITIDDDHGGIEAAQRTVNHLADQGILTFAHAYQSLHLDGSLRHDGSHLYVPLSAANDADLMKRATRNLLETTGYATDEILHRIALPFGCNTWASNEYGNLILPYQQPIKLTHLAHGVELLIAHNALVTNDPAIIAQHAPSIVLRPVEPRYKPDSPIYTNGVNVHHSELPGRFNETIRTMLNECGMKSYRNAKNNYQCICGFHEHEDKTPSIGIDSAKDLCYFNSPQCRWHNNGRPYTPFSLMQAISFNGDYKAACDEVRRRLGLPDWVSSPTLKSQIKELGLKLKENRSVSEKQRAVLRAIYLQCWLNNTTILDLSAEKIAQLAEVALITAKRALQSFDGKYLKKHGRNQAQSHQFGTLRIEIFLKPSMSLGECLNEPGFDANETAVLAAPRAENQAPPTLIELTNRLIALKVESSVNIKDSITIKEKKRVDQLAPNPEQSSSSLIVYPRDSDSVVVDAPCSVFTPVIYRDDLETLVRAFYQSSKENKLRCTIKKVIEHVHSVYPSAKIATITAIHNRLQKEKKDAPLDKLKAELPTMSDRQLAQELKYAQNCVNKYKGNPFHKRILDTIEVEIARRNTEKIRSTEPKAIGETSVSASVNLEQIVKVDAPNDLLGIASDLIADQAYSEYELLKAQYPQFYFATDERYSYQKWAGLIPDQTADDVLSAMAMAA